MMYITNKKLQRGMKIGRPVYDDDGRILLNSGVLLNDLYINKLIEKEIPGIYILTEETEDIQIPEIISQQTRLTAISQVKDVFESIQVGKTFDMTQLNQSVNSIIDEITSNNNILINLSEIRTYDGYTFAHSVNVCVLSIVVGLKLQLNQLELKKLAVGAILHDIGKTCIPANLINKTGRLNQKELSEIQRHTIHGWQILRNHPEISLLSAHIAYQHHEQPNGHGYPRRLIDEQINQNAKIVSVVDAYDAMTSARPYRNAMQPSQALHLIRQLSGIQFSPSAAKIFLQCVAPYPIGSRVLLNTREIGVVVDVNNINKERPVIRLLFRPDGKKYNNVQEVDLAKETFISIEKGLL